jgi:hypothetical protein
LEDVNNISFPDATWENLEVGDEDVTHRSNKRRTNFIFKTSKQEAISEKKCIAFEGAILKLIHFAVGKTCSLCHEPIDFTTTMYATCMMIKWKCSYGEKHIEGIWSSQPNLFGMKAGNLLVPVCHMLSGNSYVKTALFAKFLNLGFVGQSNYYR